MSSMTTSVQTQNYSRFSMPRSDRTGDHIWTAWWTSGRRLCLAVKASKGTYMGNTCCSLVSTKTISCDGSRYLKPQVVACLVPKLRRTFKSPRSESRAHYSMAFSAARLFNDNEAWLDPEVASLGISAQGTSQRGSSSVSRDSLTVGTQEAGPARRARTHSILAVPV